MNTLRTFLWLVFGQRLFAYTPHNAYAYRTKLLKLFGMKCGHRVRARRNVCFNKPWNVTADDLVIFGDCAIVQANAPIRIGKRSVVSQYAMLITEMGDIKFKGKKCFQSEIIIKDDCWVATDVIVLPGSYIEEGVVVGARGMVHGRLPQWKICTGEPASPRADRVLYGTR